MIFYFSIEVKCESWSSSSKQESLLLEVLKFSSYILCYTYGVVFSLKHRLLLSEMIILHDTKYFLETKIMCCGRCSLSFLRVEHIAMDPLLHSTQFLKVAVFNQNYFLFKRNEFIYPSHF